MTFHSSLRSATGRSSPIWPLSHKYCSLPPDHKSQGGPGIPDGELRQCTDCVSFSGPWESGTCEGRTTEGMPHPREWTESTGNHEIPGPAFLRAQSSHAGGLGAGWENNTEKKPLPFGAESVARKSFPFQLIPFHPPDVVESEESLW